MKIDFILDAAVKALGIKIPPEALRQIEALLPQLPAKVNEAIAFILAWQKNFDERLHKIEELQIVIMEVLQHGRDNGNNGSLYSGTRTGGAGNDGSAN